MKCLRFDLELNALKNKQGWKEAVKCMVERQAGLRYLGSEGSEDQV